MEWLTSFSTDDKAEILPSSLVDDVVVHQQRCHHFLRMCLHQCCKCSGLRADWHKVRIKNKPHFKFNPNPLPS